MESKFYWKNNIKRDPGVIFNPPLKIREGEGAL